MEAVTRKYQPANQNKPWVSGFGEPLDDNDLVNRARIAVALEMYPEDTIVPALVRTVDRLEAEKSTDKQGEK